MNRVYFRKRIKGIWFGEAIEGDKVEQLLNSVSEYLEQQKMPFNRNQLSVKSRRELTNHVASLLPANSTVLSVYLTSLIILLCERNADGTMGLDVKQMFEEDMSIGECISRLEKDKENRIKDQKRNSASKRRSCRQVKGIATGSVDE